MKLVQNGELGYLVDESQLKSLKTVNDIDDMLNMLAVGDFEPHVRDNDTTVDPLELMDYLEKRKDKIIKRELEQPTTTTQRKAITRHAPVSEVEVDRRTHEQELSMREAELMVEMTRKDDIIRRLLTVAKEQRSKDAAVEDIDVDDIDVDDIVSVNDYPVFDGDLDMESKSGNISAKGPIREVVAEISGDRKVSDFANVAMARGLFGDERAEVLIDEMYGDGVYREFIDSLGG